MLRFLPHETVAEGNIPPPLSPTSPGIAGEKPANSQFGFDCLCWVIDAVPANPSALGAAATLKEAARKHQHSSRALVAVSLSNYLGVIKCLLYVSTRVDARSIMACVGWLVLSV